MTTSPRAHTRRFLHAAARTALNFVRERTNESCSRLCALMCCTAGCIIGLGTLMFAHLHPECAAVVAALTGLVSALIAGGCVAILGRTRLLSGGTDSVVSAGGAS